MEVFNGQIKDHPTKRSHYDTPAQLKTHIMEFLLAYNFQRTLKALNLETAVGRKKDAQDIGVHGEIKKVEVTLVVMRHFFMGLLPSEWVNLGE